MGGILKGYPVGIFDGGLWGCAALEAVLVVLAFHFVIIALSAREFSWD